MPLDVMDAQSTSPIIKQESAYIISVLPADVNNRRLVPYEPNYILPEYYSDAPYRQIYAGNTPDNEGVSSSDVKFQISFKIPLLRLRVRDRPVGLSMAYTQLSYWQLYQPSAYFRENNYQPALFLETPDKVTFGSWDFGLKGIGVVHESNGRGGALERSWNRVFLNGGVTHGRWSLDYDIWYVLKDRSYETYNPEMVRYLGYGRWILNYDMNGQKIALLSRNNFTSGFSRGFTQLSWSFPLAFIDVTGVDGYVQLSSGYGQSLIEYDHRTDAIGIGLSFNDW